MAVRGEAAAPVGEKAGECTCGMRRRLRPEDMRRVELLVALRGVGGGRDADVGDLYISLA